MAFVPLIKACLQKDNSGNYQLQPDDITDVYDVADNVTGWEDASTLLATNLSTATLTITDPIGVTTVIDVLSQIPIPVIGKIEFNPLDSSNGISITDGYYKILYTLYDGATTYTACIERYFYPNIQCCISKLLNKLRADNTNETLIKDINKVKAWETILCAAASTVDKTTADLYIKLLTDYCDYKACNCK